MKESISLYVDAFKLACLARKSPSVVEEPSRSQQVIESELLVKMGLLHSLLLETLAGGKQ